MFFRLLVVTPKAILISLLLLLAVAVSVPAAANAEESIPVLPSATFTNTDDASVQQKELAAYVAANTLNSHPAQVDLAYYPKISQFTDIDSSAQGFGGDACGLVAAATAMGGRDWIPLVYEIANAAGKDYGTDSGIQPAEYVAALDKVFGSNNVTAVNNSTLGAMYQQLLAGKVIIVDIKVNSLDAVPSANPPNYSHFARVIGMDVAKQEIYLQNTLQGGAYWTISFADFVEAWKLPETSASIIPDPMHAEGVTRWMVILNPTQTTAIG